MGGFQGEGGCDICPPELLFVYLLGRHRERLSPRSFNLVSSEGIVLLNAEV